MYEVEQKYRVDDVAALERRLDGLAARWQGEVGQVDRYFSHPCRDFAAADEALRLRSTDTAAAITWKGPKLDGSSKTRREIELPLNVAAAPTAAHDVAAAPVHETIARWTELLGALGFHPVREVAKRRRIAMVAWEGTTVEVALDHVAGLGDFVELEIQAAAEGLAAARAGVESLARHLGCTASERRSYLELLLAR